MDILGLGSKVDVEFIFERQEQRKQIEVKIDENKKSTQYIYYDGEDVNGTVIIREEIIVGMNPFFSHFI